MANIFTDVALPKVQSNSFGMNNDFKLSCNMGKLIPVNLIECIPGDQINASTTVMMRMAPMLAPVMHEVDVYIHHFFVPNRIVWPNWEKFITAGVPNEDTPAYPYLADVPSKNGDLLDLLGCPSDNNGELILDKISAVPCAGYQAIWYEYYRDENLVQPVTGEDFYVLQDGLNTNSELYKLQTRAWQHDYFTSNLPWAQKGDPVNLPLGGNAPVVMNPASTALTTQFDLIGSGTISAGNHTVISVGKVVPDSSSDVTSGGAPAYVKYDPKDTLITDLSDATAVNINALRWAVKLQEFLERNARGGTRYIESILAHFGVRSSDKRLQRPEFLGGSSTPMVISEVLQTSQTSTSPQANMAGHGLSVGNTGNINYFVEEHGFFFSIMSVRPKTAYQQGIPRHFSKFDPLQFAWPTFANLGEQETLNREIYYDPEDDLNDATFGYLPRYAEYKYNPSRVSGDFKSTLDFWHMGRKFATRPVLNASFVECDPTQRIFAVEDEDYDKLYAHVFHKVQMRRRLPKFGIPNL